MYIPQMNGYWRYSENFKYGRSEGYVKIYSEQKQTMAVLNGKEIVESEDIFYFKETFTLSLKNDLPSLIGVMVEFDDPNVDFYLDDWTIIHFESNLIIAQSNDDQGVSGTVTLQRLPDKKGENQKISGENLLEKVLKKAG